MTEAIPIIAALIAAGSTVYSVDQSRKRTHESEDAAKALQAQQATDAEKQLEIQNQEQAAAQAKATETADAAAIRQRISQLSSQTGGYANTDWMTSILQSEFPSETPDNLSKAVSSFMAGNQPSGTSSSSSFFTGQ